jgi:hypothetical protein
LEALKPKPSPPAPLLYVTPSDIFSVDNLPQESYDVVLSPHYYWSKKSDRSFKNKNIAKKFSSSVFDLDDDYEYDVYASHDDMVFVAYQIEAIKERLIDQGIDLKSIKSLYLSQGFFKELEFAIEINESESLVELEGVLAVVPTEFLDQTSEEDELRHLAKDKKERLNLGNIGDSGLLELKIPAIAVAVTFSLWIVSSFINLNQTNSELIAKQEAVKSKYKLPATSFQLKSVLKRLEKVDKKQQFYREVLHALSSKKRELASAVQSVTMKDKLIEVTFIKPIPTKVKQYLQKSLKPYTKSIHFSTKKSITTMEAKR